MTVERHTIWLEPEEWDALVAEAAKRATNPSGLVRLLLGRPPVGLTQAFADAAQVPLPPVETPLRNAMARDSFAEFHPAPKKGAKS